MTDNDIIKAVECCIKEDCKNCPYFASGLFECGEHFNEDVLDLINRQKAEIERLSKAETFDKNITKLLDIYEVSIKAEAVKEFAEKIKISLDDLPSYSEEDFIYVDEFELRDKIDNLVKEMVGDTDV